MSPAKNADQWTLLIAVLGVVYGDIGTSPLYAIRDAFFGLHPVPLIKENILGILSLVYWALVLVVCIKYLWIVLKGDNEGEGGITALLALLMPKNPGLKISKQQKNIILWGLLGAALLYGEGMLAPATSVLSAVEGINTATPLLSHYVVPVTVLILVVLFMTQKRGTFGIGMLFGPAMALWFTVIALSGSIWIARVPEVLAALNPLYALKFVFTNGVVGFLSLGSVVLCVTGAEALFAAMGHFSKDPIRKAWFWIVFPALVLNYFGQGALLLEQGDKVTHPFFQMASEAYRLPLIAIATVAAVIASQAVITGAFSLTQQATQLGYLPRFLVVHTSENREGQIFIPRVNQFLLIGCILLVVWFKSSTYLVGAYGISVIGTMLVTTYLIYRVALEVWGWSLRRARLMLFGFMFIDLGLLAASFLKITTGGWISVLLGLGIFVIMATWSRGRRVLTQEMVNKATALNVFIAKIKAERPERVRGTAIFLTPSPNIAPTVLLHHYRHNKILHERVVMLTFLFKHVPFIPYSEHARVTELEEGIFQVTATYGYMQKPSVQEVMDACKNAGFDWDVDKMSYYLGRETLIASGRSKMALWRKKLFCFMAQNAQPATAFFGLPSDRVVEIGLQLEI